MYHWSTDTFPASQAYDAWCAELETSTIPWLTGVEAAPAFSAQYTGISLGTQNVMKTQLSCFDGKRKQREISRSDGGYVSVQFTLAGRENVSYFDNREQLQAGQAYIWDSEEEFTFEVTEELETLSLRLPRQDFLVQSDGGVISRRKIRFDTGIGAVLYRTVLAAFQENEALPGGHADLLEQAILPLASAAFATSATDILQDGARTSLFRRLLNYIDCNLADHTLSVESVAGEMGISRRYLHTLFASNSMTFSGYLRSRRAERAKRELMDRGNKSTITMIAYRNGFGGSSHFSRVFKGINGVSPREFRKMVSEN